MSPDPPLLRTGAAARGRRASRMGARQTRRPREPPLALPRPHAPRARAVDLGLAVARHGRGQARPDALVARVVRCSWGRSSTGVGSNCLKRQSPACATDREGNNFNGFKDFRTENGSSEGQNLAVTVLCVQNSLVARVVRAAPAAELLSFFITLEPRVE